MVIYKKNDYLSYMGDVAKCKARITSLNDQWENIKLLCEINCPYQSKTLIPTMTATQDSFDNLQQQLVDTLVTETLNKMDQKLLSKAQVAVDVLIRNLYERTADVGFLATDDDIRTFVALNGKDQSARERIVARLREYVAKYSVYEEIIILDKNRTVLANLDKNNKILGKKIDAPNVTKTLESAEAFFELFAPSPLQAARKKAHMFTSRIYAEESGEVIGVICLCFRFENEMDLIFKKLSTDYDGSAILIVDENNTVIASNDENHVPTGIAVETVEEGQNGIVYYRGMAYIVKTVPTQGYQDYYGLGWRGMVMQPLHLAFKEKSELQGIGSGIVGALMSKADSFSTALNEIIVQTQTINKSLKRIVYNGQLIDKEGVKDEELSRLKPILNNIGKIGAGTSSLFKKSVADLFSTVISTSLLDAGFLASLCIDIMDRNLYERANDCRWWVLNSTFRSVLAQDAISDKDQARLTKILAYIHSLYTVYSNLFLYDKTGRIVAVSNPEYRRDVGTTLSSAYIHSTLSNAKPEKYFVSPFEETPLYDGKHTYIYSASVTDIKTSNRVVGGIGIVFDSEFEFSAMLGDALKSKKDTFAVFTDRKGSVISSTGEQIVGETLKLPGAWFDVKHGEVRREILVYNGSYFAVGCACSASYREYKSTDGYVNDVLAFVFVKLTDEASEAGVAVQDNALIEQRDISLKINAAHDKLVAFYVNGQLFALEQEVVYEATDSSEVIPLPDSNAMIRGALCYRGEYIAVVDTHMLFKGAENQQPGGHLLIIKPGEDVFMALEVDELSSVLEVNAEDIRPVPEFGGASSVAGILSVRGEKDCNVLVLNHMSLLTKLQKDQAGYDWEEILAILEKMNEEKSA